MDKRIEMCSECGFTGDIVDTYHAFHKAGGVDCLRRQLAAANAKLEESARLATDSAKQADSLAKDLAAANERAGRLEAEMVELRAAWFRVATHDGFNGSIEAEISEGDMAVFTRILGGA